MKCSKCGVSSFGRLCGYCTGDLQPYITRCKGCGMEMEVHGPEGDYFCGPCAEEKMEGIMDEQNSTLDPNGDRNQTKKSPKELLELAYAEVSLAKSLLEEREGVSGENGLLPVRLFTLQGDLWGILETLEKYDGS